MSWGLVAIAGASVISSGIQADAAGSQNDNNQQAIGEIQALLAESMEAELGFLAEGNVAAAASIREGTAAKIEGLMQVMDAVPGMKEEIARISERFYQDAREVYQPFLADKPAANRAFDQQLSMLGLPGIDGTVNAFDATTLESRPSYQFVRDQGLKGADRSAAARTGSLGGRAVRESERFASGLASQEFNNEFNRVGSVANALNRSAQFGAQGTSNAANAAASQIISSYNHLNGQILQAMAGIGEAEGEGHFALGHLAMANAGDKIQVSQNQTNSLAALNGASTASNNALINANANAFGSSVEAIGAAAGGIFGNRGSTDAKKKTANIYS